MGADDARLLARMASRVVIAKGKKVTTFSMTKDKPDEATLLAHMLGPTGNLRAPTIRAGKTLVVGFDEGTYRSVFT